MVCPTPLSTPRASLTRPTHRKYQYDTVFAPFQAKYAEENDGRMPFLNPTVAARINYYKNATEERFETARQRQLEFKSFFEDEVVIYDEESCSSVRFLFPFPATKRSR